jgi:AraC family transcriptional regulator
MRNLYARRLAVVSSCPDLLAAPMPANNRYGAMMALTARNVAAGPGWRVDDVVCNAGPADRPFEERYAAACIATVTEGSFECRSTTGAAVLAPGTLLLGDAGDRFECSHRHGAGDRCLAFRYEPDFLERIVAAVPGVQRLCFAVPSLPPLPRLLPLCAAAEAARDAGDGALLEELALRLAGAAAAALADAGPPPAAPSPRDARRISAALRRIEVEAGEFLTLADLARDAGMSPYHFLRVFCRVVGMTPYQYVLRTRLHRAAVRLRRSGAPVLAVALDAGFADLSTFNRRFRRLIGMTPSTFRSRR